MLITEKRLRELIRDSIFEAARQPDVDYDFDPGAPPQPGTAAAKELSRICDEEDSALARMLCQLLADDDSGDDGGGGDGEEEGGPGGEGEGGSGTEEAGIEVGPGGEDVGEAGEEAAEESQEGPTADAPPHHSGFGNCPYDAVYADSGETVPKESLRTREAIQTTGMGRCGSTQADRYGREIKDDPRCDDVPCVAISAIDVVDALVDFAQLQLGILSIFDPTPLSDALSAGLYAAVGDYESAAIVVAASSAGAGAGALTAKLYKFTKGGIKTTLKRNDWPDKVAEDASKKVMDMAKKKGRVSRGAVKTQREVVEAVAEASAKAQARLGKNAAKLKFADRSAISDSQGRLFVAMKMPDGKTKIFYRSTGTGTPDLVKEGDWVVTNGMVAQPSSRGLHYVYVKAPGKANKPGSLEEEVDAGLKELYGTGDMKATHAFSSGKAGSITRQDVEDVAKFNRWVYKRMGKIPDQIARTDTPFLGVTQSVDDAWRGIENLQKLFPPKP